MSVLTPIIMFSVAHNISPLKPACWNLYLPQNKNVALRIFVEGKTPQNRIC